jgi:hypothetical protein
MRDKVLPAREISSCWVATSMCYSVRGVHIFKADLPDIFVAEKNSVY